MGRRDFGHAVSCCENELVLTERWTRMGIVMLLADHTAASVVKAINSLERRFERYSVKGGFTIPLHYIGWRLICGRMAQAGKAVIGQQEGTEAGASGGGSDAPFSLQVPG